MECSASQCLRYEPHPSYVARVRPQLIAGISNTLIRRTAVRDLRMYITSAVLCARLSGFIVRVRERLRYLPQTSLALALALHLRTHARAPRYAKACDIRGSISIYMV